MLPSSIFGAMLPSSILTAEKESSNFGAIRESSIFGAIRESSIFGAIRVSSIFGAIRESSIFGAIRESSIFGASRESSIFGAYRRLTTESSSCPELKKKSVFQARGCMRGLDQREQSKNVRPGVVSSKAEINLPPPLLSSSHLSCPPPPLHLNFNKFTQFDGWSSGLTVHFSSGLSLKSHVYRPT